MPEQGIQTTKKQLERQLAELTRQVNAISQDLETARQEITAVKASLNIAINEREQALALYRQTKQKLAASTNALERFYFLTRDLLCVIENQYFFSKVSRSFETTLGYSADELTQKSFLEFIHPDDVESTKNYMEEVLKGDAIVGYCNRYRCKDGSYRWLEWMVFFDEEADVCYGTARDVTERKAAEDELREKNREVLLAKKETEESWRHLNNLLQSIDAVIWQLDKDGVFTLFEGRLAKKLIGSSAGNVGLSIYELYQNYPDILKTLQRALQGIPERVEAQYNNIFISMICTPIFDNAGNVSGVAGIMADISERYARERRLKLLQESRQRYADFNQILSGKCSEEEHNRRLAGYGIDPKKPVACYLLSVTLNSGVTPETVTTREDILEWLNKHGFIWNWNTVHGICILLQNSLPGSWEVPEVKTQAQKLKTEIEQHFAEIQVRVGIACANGDRWNLKQLYDKSYAALLLAMGDDKTGGISCFCDNGIYQVLPLMLDHIDIDEFIKRFLGGIMEKDWEGELLRTLEVILSGANLKTAAKELHVHHNTILWRKDKIEKILGYSLDDANRRVHLAAALKLKKIRELMQRNI